MARKVVTHERNENAPTKMWMSVEGQRCPHKDAELTTAGSDGVEHTGVDNKCFGMVAGTTVS
jgi:hypothetical protein